MNFDPALHVLDTLGRWACRKCGGGVKAPVGYDERCRCWPEDEEEVA